MPDLIDCNGIHLGETINISDLPQLTEMFGEFDPMHPPVCDRTGRMQPDNEDGTPSRQHLDTGRHPLLIAMDENKAKGKDSDVRKIIEQVFQMAGVGIDAYITLYPVDTESFPALQIRATWRDVDSGEPSEAEIERLRLVGEKAYEAATAKMSIAEMVTTKSRQDAMRASIRAIYKEIN